MGKRQYDGKGSPEPFFSYPEALVRNHPSGSFDDAIARHASARGHWPGKAIDEIKVIIEDVRNGWNHRYAAPSGETIYRKGDVILIENPDRAEGTIFEPTSNSSEYFRRWVKNNPGGT